MQHESKVILLVEDNPDDVKLTLRAFEKNKVKNRIVVVNDGAEALEYLFNAKNDKPQVVLLDLNLPKLGGLEVLERIRADERTRRLPVVILTSSKEELDLVRGYDKGANSYVVKPVDFNTFVEAVRTLGFYWLLLNEIPGRNGNRFSSFVRFGSELLSHPFAGSQDHRRERRLSACDDDRSRESLRSRSFRRFP